MYDIMYLTRVLYYIHIDFVLFHVHAPYKTRVFLVKKKTFCDHDILLLFFFLYEVLFSNLLFVV